MAYALIDHVAAQSSNTNVATTGNIDSTTADILIAAISSYVSNPNAGASDSKSNSWTGLTAQAAAVNAHARLWYSKNPSPVGSGHNFTAISTGSSYPSIGAAVFSGAHLTSPVDQQNGATDAGVTSIATGSITPSEGNCLIIAMLSCSVSHTLSIDSGFTILDQFNITGNAFGLGVAYKIQTVAGAVNPTWSWSGSDSGVAAAIVSLKSAAGGGGGGVIPVITNQFRQRWN